MPGTCPGARSMTQRTDAKAVRANAPLNASRRLPCPYQSPPTMPPRTRLSNHATRPISYHSKTVPKQKYFSHRRKIVRERPALEHVAEKKQATFLPEKMRQQADDVARDSDDTNPLIEDVAELSDDARTRDREQVATGRRKKRMNDAAHNDSEDEETLQSSPKRRKTTAARKTRCVKTESDDDRPTPSSESEREDIKRGRRQSTMTQMVDGRRPLPGEKEPRFRPVRRSLRTSRRGNENKGHGSRDRQQRTLTQMVPGLTAYSAVSDDEEDSEHWNVEDEGIESRQYADAIERRLAEQGLFYTNSNDPPPNKNSAELSNGRVARRPSHIHGVESATAYDSPINAGKSRKSRFSLLSTPEKRRVFEIASSQSPPDSPLSTQRTPYGHHRTPLKERSENTLGAAESPPRRKQVTFQEPPMEPAPPPSLRKFVSVIQDSEDEGEEFIESDDDQGVGVSSLKLSPEMDSEPAGANIGADTQAMIYLIDRACAQVNEDAAFAYREPSEELGDLHPERNIHSHQDGEGEPRAGGDMESTSRPTPPEYRVAHAVIKKEPSDVARRLNFVLPSVSPSRQGQPTPSPGNADTSHSNASPQLSFAEHRDPTPPADHRSSQAATPVPHSSSSPAETQESDSNKAEQQLLSEYQAFSQYCPNFPPSSMHVAPDTGFSYQATPFQPRHPIQQTQPSSTMSQATTIAPTQRSPHTTPRKAKGSQGPMVPATPEKISSSQLSASVSPSKPPPLLIPSSYPSPMKVMEGWDSHITGRRESDDEPSPELETGRGFGRWGGSASIDEFSIPAPPPFDFDEDDEDEL